MSAGAAGGGAGAVVRQGHLRKLKTMKKKYFVLRAETQDCSARLEYYESEKKFRAGATPRRVLPLKSCYNITRRLDLKQKHVIALFTREEQFCIVAENEQDLHVWLTAIIKQHRTDDASEELCHPIQHVWQVNVQKKGLGSSKNIQGLYNLCLTDKTLTLVKIKSHNNVISDLGIPERIEYSLKSIRRCGDSECFFYMEVGRQTATGAGELWMHSDDSNIAQSMHSTIYLAMRNCAKETENERDHIILPKNSMDPPSHLTTRRFTFSENSKKSALSNDAGPLRNRCDSMPSRGSTTVYEVERPAPRHNEHEEFGLQRKWRMIKDSFKKDLNVKTGFRKSMKECKNYMSSDSLLLLLPSCQRQDTALYFSQDTYECDLSFSKDIVQAKNKQVAGSDEDQAFSNTLVPMMKKLTDEQKKYAKFEIMNVMERAKHFNPPYWETDREVIRTTASNTYRSSHTATSILNTHADPRACAGVTSIDLIDFSETPEETMKRPASVYYTNVFPCSLQSNSSFDSQKTDSDYFEMSPRK